LPCKCRFKNIKNAIKADVSSIEHGFFISEENIYMIKDYNVEWTPTINALYSITKFLNKEEKKYINSIIDRHIKMVYLTSNIGVKLNIGSDSGSKGIEHCNSFFEEINFFKKLGVDFKQT